MDMEYCQVTFVCLKFVKHIGGLSPKVCGLNLSMKLPLACAAFRCLPTMFELGTVANNTSKNMAMFVETGTQERLVLSVIENFPGRKKT